jgi:hypothetical protein
MDGDEEKPHFTRQRVELYEEATGRLILHCNGSSLAYRLAEPVEGHFAQHADRLASGGEPPHGSEVLELFTLPIDRWPPATGELIAMCWEDGRIGSQLRHGGSEGEVAVEPGWRARRYLAPPSVPDEDA